MFNFRMCVDPPRGDKFLHFAIIILFNPRIGYMEGGETRLERRTDVRGLGQRKREVARRKGEEGFFWGKDQEELSGGFFFRRVLEERACWRRDHFDSAGGISQV